MQPTDNMDTQKGLDQPKKTQVARRRRLQQKRANGRHLQWIFAQLQAGSSHHTAMGPVRPAPAGDVVTALQKLVKEGQELLAQLATKMPTETHSGGGDAVEQASFATMARAHHRAEEQKEPKDTNAAYDIQNHAVVSDTLMLDTLVQVTDDIEEMLNECRAAGFGTKNDDRRVAVAGMVGKIIKTDDSDGAAKIRVRHLGRVWFPVSTLSRTTAATAESDSTPGEESESEYDQEEDEESESEYDQEENEGEEGSEAEEAQENRAASRR